MLPPTLSGLGLDHRSWIRWKKKRSAARTAGLGKSSRANSWARLVEWDKRRRASDHDAAKAGKSIAAE